MKLKTNHNPIPQISVIVPIYNVEKYLAECLDSILSQTFKDFEVICVYSTSTDASLNILQQYAEKDARIKIILTKPKGLSSARNTGMKHANGKYFSFIDSDDIIKPTFLETLINHIDNADCAEINLSLYGNNIPQGAKDFYTHFNLSRPSGLEQITPDALPFFNLNTWDKLYKREIIKKYKLKFPLHRLHEDNFFTYAYLSHCKNVYYINEKLYLYRKDNKDSLCERVLNNEKNKQKVINDLMYIFRKLAKHLKKYKLLDEYKYIITYILINYHRHYVVQNIPAFRKYLRTVGIEYNPNILSENMDTP